MRTLILFILVIFSGVVFAQAPPKMSYQAVVRDPGNNLVTNQPVGMRVSILQSSVSGTPVYGEIYNPNPATNENGLVTVEIGDGIAYLGVFDAIDWSLGPYFIKTETDPTGGTNYTISGVSQLLSVPYAFHAKSAESLIGVIPELDPIWSASPSFGISNNNLINWNTAFAWGNHANAGYTPMSRTLSINGTTYDLTSNRSWNVGTVSSITMGNGLTTGTITTTGTIGLTGQALALHNLATNGIISRTGPGILSARTITAGTGISITNGNGVNGNPVIAAKTYAIGDFAHGGIVFWVDETGQHGLVCAKTDQSTGIRWYAGTYGDTWAKGDGPYSGEANTILIIASQVAIGDDGNPYAARICNELKITEGSKTYGDWYLPSTEELSLMYQNKSVINATATSNGGSGFAGDIYWASTEGNQAGAWLVNFLTGSISGQGKYNTYRVRAIRSF